MQTEARHSPSPLSLWCAFSATQQPAAAGCEGPAEPKVGVVSSCRAVSGEPHPHHGAPYTVATAPSSCGAHRATGCSAGTLTYLAARLTRKILVLGRHRICRAKSASIGPRQA